MTLKRLRPGDRIALVAPSSPFQQDKFTAACDSLTRKGYLTVPGSRLYDGVRYLAAPDAERAKDLIQAIRDPSISAIFCIRGGYGSGRLLPLLPFSSLQKSHKILLGYSDVTFLHLAFSSRELCPTFHGPNFIEMAEDDNLMESVLSTLSGSQDFCWSLDDSQILKPGVAKGRLVGGNLSCLVHLLGTQYLPDLNGAILMLEDRGEALYRLDRMITHMGLSGILDGLAGLVLGQFTECGEQQDIWDMILEHVKTFQFPVVGNLPFGHTRNNQIIPLGVMHALNTHEQTFMTLQSPFNE